ncbi:MAG: hypothetical protein CL685_00600 [Candidatus Magasanikbacteria bacterium]|nr:hypothetical protein [Candidatus Magasanikbacteria bacterium]|tara:strand:+ start:4886 stop:6241 length:1356 start_codon:yes stop_codon:yes gene_type:complete
MQNLLTQLRFNTKGSSLLLVLVFGSALLLSLTLGLSAYGTMVLRHNTQITKHAQIREIAEAGTTYYSWVLHNNPDDLWDGNPPGTPGPFVHDYTDAHGNVIGSYAISVTQDENDATSIQSTGWLHNYPNIKKTFKITQGEGGFAFPYILTIKNPGILSSDMQISGSVHSNNTLTCNILINQEIQANMIQGSGGPAELWHSPVPPIDFVGLRQDTINTLSSMAEHDEGLIIPAPHGGLGWHVVLLETGGFDLYKVTSRECHCNQHNCSRSYCNTIGNEVFVGHYDFPENGVIYVHNYVWIDGVINGKATFFTNPNIGYGFFLNDTITKKDNSGNHILGLFTRGFLIIPYDSPNNMTIEAVLMAPSISRLFRNIYDPALEKNTRNSFHLLGTYIASSLPSLKHKTNAGDFYSGYQTVQYTFDPQLLEDAPPGFPKGQGSRFGAPIEIDEHIEI